MLAYIVFYFMVGHAVKSTCGKNITPYKYTAKITGYIIFTAYFIILVSGYLSTGSSNIEQALAYNIVHSLLNHYTLLMVPVLEIAAVKKLFFTLHVSLATALIYIIIIHILSLHAHGIWLDLSVPNLTIHKIKFTAHQIKKYLLVCSLQILGLVTIYSTCKYSSCEFWGHGLYTHAVLLQFTNGSRSTSYEYNENEQNNLLQSIIHPALVFMPIFAIIKSSSLNIILIFVTVGYTLYKIFSSVNKEENYLLYVNKTTTTLIIFSLLICISMFGRQSIPASNLIGYNIYVYTLLTVYQCSYVIYNTVTALFIFFTNKKHSS